MGSRTPTAAGVVGWLVADVVRVRGVARLLAQRSGAHLLVVRVAFCVLGFAGGAGLVIYGLAWVLNGGRDESTSRAPSTRSDVGVVLLVAAVLSAVTSTMHWLPVPLLWLISLAAMGMAIAAISPAGGDAADAVLRGAPARAGVGVVLVIAAVATALAGTQDLAGLWRGLLTVVALVAGLSIVVAPWFARLTATAEHERLERIRAEERADIASHLHDSVLQTLTLIQNRANEPQVVAALAHQQERELRRWLYGSDQVAPVGTATLRTVIESTAAEIEEQYLIAIETIIVGDSALTPAASAIAAAAREALVNAAKFSGSSLVSVFADISDREIAVFVRDRGTGFDQTAIPPDRRGITESIVGRVERVGGRVVIRSTVGTGTEVALTLPVAVTVTGERAVTSLGNAEQP